MADYHFKTSRAVGTCEQLASLRELLGDQGKGGKSRVIVVGIDFPFSGP